MVRGRGPQPVISMDADGIETYYPSLKAAADAVGAKSSDVSNACTSGHKYRGLYFRKAEIKGESLTRTQASVILAFAYNGMRIKPAADVLYRHWNSVDYNLNKVRQKTGKDPKNFFDLYELVQIARKVLEDEN